MFFRYCWLIRRFKIMYCKSRRFFLQIFVPFLHVLQTVSSSDHLVWSQFQEMFIPLPEYFLLKQKRDNPKVQSEENSLNNQSIRIGKPQVSNRVSEDIQGCN